MTQPIVISGNIVDVVAGRVFPGTVEIEQGRIARILPDDGSYDCFVIPGLIDAHVHIESSMLPPSEFARLAVAHGTVATLSDPHEIANVLGLSGIDYMLANAATTPFKFHFGAPSCVPATGFESAGATLGVAEVEKLLADPRINHLSEMMNFPGVLHGDSEVAAKLALARAAGKPVDGHAPGLKGDAAARYIAAGISTDHECFSLAEAREKIAYGMKVLIREGSAAKNLAELAPLLAEANSDCMLCSDDKHPDDLVQGHINLLLRQAVCLGIDPMDALRSATLNPVRHYHLNVGLLQAGDAADLCIVDNLRDFNVLACRIDGQLVAAAGKSLLSHRPAEPTNRFLAEAIMPESLRIAAKGRQIRAIAAIEGQLVTRCELIPASLEAGAAVSDPARDLLKITVLNRYEARAMPALGFIRGFGLTRGAIASTVAHDSHNIVAVGASDAAMARAINALIEHKGGICVVDGDAISLLPLPIAGLMSNLPGEEVAARYAALNAAATALGCPMHAPFMTLSFMALLVIPSLKLGDRGLFDGEKFAFTHLFAAEAV